MVSNRVNVAFLTILLACNIGLADQTLVLDECDYKSPEAARETWKPSERGTPPIQVAEKSLRLPCPFSTLDSWRTSWDRNGRWDLARSQKFCITVLVDGDKPASLIFYFRSGEGWYGHSFAAPPGRNTVELEKKSFGVEGQPAGWHKVDGLRLSVVRDRPVDREIHLRDIEAVAREAHVAIYRNDAGIKSESGVPQYVEQMADRLDRLAIGYEILGDSELSADRLADKQVLVLPLNPVLDKQQAAVIQKFVAGGGRLMVFYSLPAPLDKLLGLRTTGSTEGREKNASFTFSPADAGEPIAVTQNSWWSRNVAAADGTTVRATWLDSDGRDTQRPAVTRNANGFFVAHVLTEGDETAKDRLILEMVGELWTGAWKQLYERRKPAFDDGGRYHLLLAKARHNLADVASFQRAESLAEKGDWASAARQLALAEEAVRRLYAASIAPREGEWRAVWCHSPTGVEGMTWDEAMATLKQEGFTAIIPNMSWGATGAYPSKVLSPASNVVGDQLAACLAAAKTHGIEVHVWRVNWNLWWNCPPARKAALRRAGRLQVDRDGKPIDWLCPSHPLNQTHEIDAMVEVARNYEVAGIHFDYIRYPGEDGCYCDGCRERFEKRVGHTVASWPAGVLSGPDRPAWLQFRRDNITAVVAAVSEQARKARPGIKISAAVFRNWDIDRDGVGQDWKLWCEKGYLDIVCPMQYTEDPALFAAWTRRNRELAGNVRFAPGIGATIRLQPEGTLQMVQLAREQNADGFVLFNFSRELIDHLNLLSLGATRQPAQSP